MGLVLEAIDFLDRNGYDCAPAPAGTPKPPEWWYPSLNDLHGGRSSPVEPPHSLVEEKVNFLQRNGYICTKRA